MGQVEGALVDALDRWQVGCMECCSLGMIFIGFLLGYSGGIVLGQVKGCELGASDVDFLLNVE